MTPASNTHTAQSNPCQQMTAKKDVDKRIGNVFLNVLYSKSNLQTGIVSITQTLIFNSKCTMMPF